MWRKDRRKGRKKDRKTTARRWEDGREEGR